MLWKRNTIRPIRTSMDREKRPKLSQMVLGLVASSWMVLVIIFMIMLIVSFIEQESPSLFHTVNESSASPIKELRNEFRRRYGDYADVILDKGVETYGNIEETSRRLLRAKAHNRPFVMAFAGYSVTVGRGNYFSQSFPFVTERILKGPLDKVLGVSLTVRNGAIGGIPSFPHGWCLSHFLGDDADVVSWDYSMNEGRGAAILESYIRHALQLSKRPKFILLDNNKERSNLLKGYASMGLLPDAIRVSRADFLKDDLPQMKHPPPGFQEWNEWGAPGPCPGKGMWHPKKMEHEMIGWMIAMHMVDAIEDASQKLQHASWQEVYGKDYSSTALVFPKPLQKPPKQTDFGITQLMYGNFQMETGKHEMNSISCRTSFLPAVDQDTTLESVVVSGLADVSQIDIMQERSDKLYQSGWVMDVSKVERETKKKVEKCGGLGYVDMKVAFYGIPESGTFRLWLPSSRHSENGSDARHYFENLVICEANESRDKDACQLDTDVSYVVGCVEVGHVDHVVGAAEYLKRKTCISIGIPIGAKTARLRDVQGDNERFLPSSDTSANTVGLLVDITAKAHVSREKGACCVSHIIWEQSSKR